MKIERASIKTLGTYQTGSPQRLNSKAKAANQHTSNVDKVDVSERAVQVASLKAKLGTAPEVRTELVERIKAQVDAGQYSVDSHKVAETILRAKVLEG